MAYSEAAVEIERRRFTGTRADGQPCRVCALWDDLPLPDASKLQLTSVDCAAGHSRYSLQDINRAGPILAQSHIQSILARLPESTTASS